YRAAVGRERFDPNTRSLLKLLLNEVPHRRLDLGLRIQRCPAVADYLLERWLVEDTETVRANLANVIRLVLQSESGVVDSGGIQLGLAKAEPQLWKMGHFVNLSARRFEEDHRPNPAVDVAERTGCIGIEGPGMGLGAGDVAVDGGPEPGLSQLSQNHATELRH